jgi:signal transduction histidine kinase
MIKFIIRYLKHDRFHWFWILLYCIVFLIPNLSYSTGFVQDRIEFKDDTSSVNFLNEKASDFINQGKMDSARLYIKNAMARAVEQNDREGEAFSWANLGNFYYRQGKFDSVIVELEEPFQKFGDTAKVLSIGNLIATAYRQKGDLNQSLNLYLELLEKAKLEGNIAMQTAIEQNVAVVYEQLGDLSAAIDHYFEGLRLAEEQSDSSAIPVILENLALISMDQEEFDRAGEYLDRAVHINEEQDNIPYLINNYINLGVLSGDVENFERSLEYFEQALQLAEKIGDIQSPVQILYNIGNNYLEQSDLDKAEQNYRKSLSESRSISSSVGIYYNQIGLGSVLLERGDTDSANTYFNSSLDLAEQFSNPNMKIEVLEKLIETEEAEGDFEAAYNYQKEYVELVESENAREREDAIAKYETLLDLRAEKENREILEENVEAQRTTTMISLASLLIISIALIAVIFLYRKKEEANASLNLKNEEIEKAHEIKDRLLSILSHDLRTPLSNLQSVVYLLKEGVLKNEDIDELLKKVDLKLNQGIVTLDNYLQWARTQKDGVNAFFETLNLQKEIDDVVNTMRDGAINKGINIQNRIDDNISVKADIQLTRVIVRNLLSNAIKFVPPGGAIIFDAIDRGSTVEMAVRDNGMGISEENQKMLFKAFKGSETGTMSEIGTGLGLSICKEFAEKQGGSIRVESEKGNGTIFYVELKKAAA